MDDEANIAQLAADIVAAYVANNPLPQAELPGVIAAVHGALAAAGSQETPVAKTDQKPAVAIRRSVTPEYLVCLEDGKQFRTLKRHLRAEHDMTPEQYRQKWGLKPDYPIVAPDYTQQRSQMARKMGLGQRKGK